jgi:TonB-linked SusC/RagA family outer membrane protein
MTFCLSIAASATTYSQNTLLNIDVSNTKVRDVLKNIEKQSQFRFFYNDDFADLNKKVSLSVKDRSVDDILNVVLDDSKVNYEIMGNNFIVITPTKLFQQIEITGNVTDEVTGEPLPGVNILIEGTSEGTISGVDGNYTISVPNKNVILVFSYVGYLSESRSINGETSINVSLTPDIQSLEEIVVVGYGTQKRIDLTGSVSSVPKGMLEEKPVSNVLNAIQGSVAGVNIIQESTAPGGDVDFYIRGLNSISAKTKPLLVVDGVPYDGNYNDLNMNDIESINILKDASSTAIYGTRGSNGVVMITTKRGKTGKPSISYNMYTGAEMMTHALEPEDGAAYRQKNLDYFEQTGGEPKELINQTEIDNYAAGKEVNWLDEISQRGTIQNHEINISGGTESVRYYVSGGYQKQKGVLKGYQFERYSVRANFDFDITNWLKAGTTLSYIDKNTDGGRASLYQAMRCSPYGSVYDDNGDYAILPMAPETYYLNALSNLYDSRVSRIRSFNSNFFAEATIYKGLKYKFSYAHNHSPDHYSTYENRKSGNEKGYGQIKDKEKNRWLVENLLTYNNTFGKHEIGVTLLYSAQEDTYLETEMRGTLFLNDVLEYYNLDAAETQQVYSKNNQRNYLSQMGRINYNYDHKYLFTATARRDAYSAFGPNNKWALFPSFALGWNIAQEDFLSSVEPLDLLKLRFSFGEAGNQAIDPYLTLSTLGTAQYIYNNESVTALYPSKIGNEQLKWEHTKSLNLALDFGLMNSRINGTLEWYKSTTSDLLLKRKIPNMSGYTEIWDNIGSTENTGIEFSINSVNISNSDFSWRTGFNISANKNKITRLYGDDTDDIGNKWFIDKPLKAVYDYNMLGVWQVDDDFSAMPSANPGDLKFEDINNDSVINSDDKKYLGTNLPDFIFGFSNTFTYKNLSLDVFIQGSQGGIKGNAAILDYNDQALRMNLLKGIGYWTEENRSNTRPSLAYTNQLFYGYPESSSYIRIKDITLSYNINLPQLQKYNIGNISVYVSGRNLYTFTKWHGWDPETEKQGFRKNEDDKFYPYVSTLVFGLKLGIQ